MTKTYMERFEPALHRLKCALLEPPFSSPSIFKLNKITDFCKNQIEDRDLLST